MDHEAIQSLLGAYALNAVEPNEGALVEAHSRECAECRTELDEHLQVASLLPADLASAPDDLWDTISREIDPAEGAGGAAAAGRSGASTLVALPVWRRRWLAPAAAAAAFVLLASALVVQSVRLGNIRDDLTAERQAVAALSEQVERPGLDTALLQAKRNPATQQVMLGSQNGSNAIIVLMPDGTGYLAEHTLTPLPPERTYQLWAIVDGKVISAGVLGSDPGVVPFHIDPEGFEGFAITEEVVGGVESSQNDPVVAWLAA